ncbi:MAG TPA: CrcB family protein [Longimicrobiales bacterium]
MQTVLLIGAGGMVGAVLRYGAVTAVQRLAGPGFPWGTLLVNVVGSLILGALLVVTDRMASGEAVRRFAAVGVLGAFTTFSAFSAEVVTMLRDGVWLRAGTYAAVSVGLAVGALAAGVAMTTHLLRD